MQQSDVINYKAYFDSPLNVLVGHGRGKKYVNEHGGEGKTFAIKSDNICWMSAGTMTDATETIDHFGEVYLRSSFEETETNSWARLPILRRKYNKSKAMPVPPPPVTPANIVEQRRVEPPLNQLHDAELLLDVLKVDDLHKLGKVLDAGSGSLAQVWPAPNARELALAMRDKGARKMQKLERAKGSASYESQAGTSSSASSSALSSSSSSSSSSLSSSAPAHGAL